MITKVILEITDSEGLAEDNVKDIMSYQDYKFTISNTLGFLRDKIKYKNLPNDVIEELEEVRTFILDEIKERNIVIE